MKNLYNQNLIKKIKILKSKKKKIVLCHGVFDLVHIGHLSHFRSAKNLGDFLIVSLTRSKFIKKGPGRPLFNDEERYSFLKQISIIDEVIFSEVPSSIDVLEMIKPDFYVKGPDYKNNLDDKTKKIYLEKKIVKKFGGKIAYTDDQTFSSSNIINSQNLIFNNVQSKFLSNLKKKYSYSDIWNILKKFKKLKILVIGELIIDKYCFGDVIGKAGKEPHLVLNEKFTEYYLGGSAAIARHLSTFVKSIGIISPFGKESNYSRLISKTFNSNIKKIFFKPYNNFKTITKTRLVDIISNYKLFGSYILPTQNYSLFENKVSKLIKSKIKNVDMIIICDYGHHFISNKIAKTIGNLRKFISLNAQTNASNIGYHTINKYSNINLLVINESELRQEMRDNISNIEILSKKLIKEKKIKNLVVTQGKNGVLMIDNKFKKTFCPAFAKNTIDKVGAGDAMLAMTSLSIKMGLDPDLTLLLGSLAAANSVETIGNKGNISLEKISRSLEYILK